MNSPLLTCGMFVNAWLSLVSIMAVFLFDITGERDAAVFFSVTAVIFAVLAMAMFAKAVIATNNERREE